MMQNDERFDGGPSRILVIDDNESIHEDFRKVLDGGKPDSDLLSSARTAFFGPSAATAVSPAYEVDSAQQGQQGYEMVIKAVEESRPYAVAFVDMRMPPGWDGVETIDHIWQIDEMIQVVICTAYSDYSWSQILDRLGNSDRLLILKKPFDNIEVCQLASALSQKHRLTLEVQRQMDTLNLAIEDRTAALTQSECNVRAILESAAECIISANHAGEIIEFNPSAEKVFGYSRNEVLGRGFAELIIPPSLRSKHALGFARFVERGGSTILGKRLELTAMRRDGSEFPIEITVTMMRRDGNPFFTGILHDISDRREMEERLRYEATHDSLTNLPNRALFMNFLEQAVAHAQRRTDYGFAVLFLDLDRFKNINDSLGHLIGDQLLIETAGRLQTCIRPNDTVARFGGDEFAVLLDDLIDPKEAVRIAERINSSLAKPFNLDGHHLHTGASIGIALGAKNYDQPDDVLRDADIGMYQAKARGKGRYVLFSSEMHDKAKQLLDTENELRDAINNRELVNFYQPIVSLETGQQVALESLVRWQHPDRGLIPPAQFLPTAEELGMMVRLDWYVLRSSLRHLAQWKGCHNGDRLFVSVNLSPRHLLEKGIARTVEVMIAEHNLSAEDLAIEVTEQAILDKSSTVSNVMNDLRSLGVRLWLDDFGTGYSSLSYLHRFPFDTLKIDRSFLPTETNNDNWHIIAAVIQLAHDLGMTVVAEGVETQEQADRLQSLNCDFGQGYLFSRPLPCQEAALFLDGEEMSQLGICAADTESPSTAADAVNA